MNPIVLFVSDYLTVKRYRLKQSDKEKWLSVKRLVPKKGVFILPRNKCRALVWYPTHTYDYTILDENDRAIDLYGVSYSDKPDAVTTLYHPKQDREGEEDEKLPYNLVRVRTQLVNYALSNEFEFFVTLTIDAEKHDRYDLSAFKKKLGIFLNNYKKRKGGDVQYLLVPEFHKDGAVHMHGLIMGIPPEEMSVNSHGYLDWPAYSSRFGYFSCSRIRDYERCAAYVSKYVTKDLAKLPKGSQVLLVSKGLECPETLFKGSGGKLYFEPKDYENEFIRLSWYDDKWDRIPDSFEL